MHAMLEPTPGIAGAPAEEHGQDDIGEFVPRPTSAVRLHACASAA
jgi:hypothetical protein